MLTNFISYQTENAPTTNSQRTHEQQWKEWSEAHVRHDLKIIVFNCYLLDNRSKRRLHRIEKPTKDRVWCTIESPNHRSVCVCAYDKSIFTLVASHHIGLLRVSGFSDTFRLWYVAVCKWSSSSSAHESTCNQIDFFLWHQPKRLLSNSKAIPFNLMESSIEW